MNPNRRAVVGTAAWVVVLAAGVAIGHVLLSRGVRIVLPTPPVLAAPVGASILGMAFAAAVGFALVAALPVVTARVGWRWLLVAVAAASLVWWVGLALAEGGDGLVRGPSWWTEYLHDVPAVRADPAGFLRNFTSEIERYEIHVRGHPPGMVLLLAGLDSLGMGGPRWEAALVLAVASSAPIAVLLTARDTVDEAFARRAAPFLVLAPAAIWIATSADALYMGVAAWAVCAVVLATSAAGRRSDALAVLGGVLGAAALFGSYGMVLVAAIPAATAWRRRRARPVVLAAATTVAVLATLVPLGFSWIEGLATTRHEYEVLDLERPYLAFFVINLAAWALALGPATFAGLAVLRDRRAWSVVGGGLAAAALANVSGLSEGEVERIWLPFGLWVLPAGAALVTARISTRVWLCVQVVVALAVVGTVRTQW